MTIDDLRSLYAYNVWANQRIFDSIGQLTPAQIVQPLGGSFASIRDTIAHMVFAEWLWLQRWQGESPRTQPEWVKGDIASLREKLTSIERERVEFFDTLSDDRLTQTVTITDMSGKTYGRRLGDMIIHVANHATYHRGQVVTMTRQLGGTPQSTDFIRFVSDR
jgi:uncharacterized damage-inducible protein DinB